MQCNKTSPRARCPEQVHRFWLVSKLLNYNVNRNEPVHSSETAG
jgi:hypothetical protein